MTSLPHEMTAAEWVIAGAQACLPPGVPLPFTVKKARYLKKGLAQATVLCFDGQEGVVQIGRHSVGSAFSGWTEQWIELTGALNWTGSEWERVPNVAFCY